MGFLKKKPSARGEHVRTNSDKIPASISGLISPASARSAPVVIDEERDDTSNISKRTDAASVTKKRESREKAAAPKSSSAGGTTASKTKKKAVSSSPRKEPSSVTKTGARKDSATKRKPHSSSTTKAKDGSNAAASATTGERNGRSTASRPVLNKKKATKPPSSCARSRSASKTRRGRSITPATPKGPTAKKVASAKKESSKSASAIKSKKTDTTSKITNGKGGNKSSKKQVAKAGKSSSRRVPSSSRSKSRPKRGKSAHRQRSTSRSHRRGTSSNIKKRLQQHYDEETSVSSCGSGSSYYSSDSDSDQYTTEAEGSTMYTNESGSFSSYPFTDEDASFDTGVGHSDSYGTDGELGMAVSPRGYKSSFDSNTMDESRTPTGAASRMSSFKSGSKKSYMSRAMTSTAKKGLSSALGNIADKAKKDNDDKDDSATPTSPTAATNKKAVDTTATPENTGGESKESRVSPDTILTEQPDDEDEGTKGTFTTATSGSKGIGAKSHASSTYADYMMKMDGFTVKNPNHQLVMQVSEHGNVEKLLLQELSYIPTPSKPSDVVIKVDASTITLQDCMIRRGKWYEMQSLPFIPGSDLVGTVHELGEEAKKRSTFQVGDKVAAYVPSGGNAKYAIIPYQNIIRVPNETDSAMALCLSSTYVPAREALDLARKLNTPFTGANILIIGGNGPSGLATIELALLEGANVFTTADERHHEYLTNLGAKCFPIDPAKWLPSLQGKMDVVMDSVCLDGYDSSGLALNPAGCLVCTGMSAVYTQGQIRAFGLRDVRDYKAAYCRMRAKYLMSSTVYYDRMERYISATNEYAQHFRYLCHLASKDTITPLVSSRSPLNKVPSMQKSIEHGDTDYGVCVCMPWTTAIESSAETTDQTAETKP